MIDMYDKLQDMLEEEIDKIVKNGSITQNSLCNLDTLVDVIKDVEEVKAMREYGYSGNNGMNYRDGYTGYDVYGRNGMGSYARSRSYGYYGRGDNNGNNQGNGYSTDGGKEHMISLMEEAMNHATTREEHDEIMKMIEKMNRK